MYSFFVCYNKGGFKILDFLKAVIPILFIISLISLKINPLENKICSGIKKFFNVLAMIFIILIKIYILILIVDVIFSIFFGSILGGLREFLLGFGF